MRKLTHALTGALAIMLMACGTLVGGLQSANAQTPWPRAHTPARLEQLEHG